MSVGCYMSCSGQHWKPGGNLHLQKDNVRQLFGPHLSLKCESRDKSVSFIDFIRPIFLVFHFSLNWNLAVH